MAAPLLVLADLMRRFSVELEGRLLNDGVPASVDILEVVLDRLMADLPKHGAADVAIGAVGAHAAIEVSFILEAGGVDQALGMAKAMIMTTLEPTDLSAEWSAERATQVARLGA